MYPEKRALQAPITKKRRGMLRALCHKADKFPSLATPPILASKALRHFLFDPLRWLALYSVSGPGEQA